MPGTNVVQSLDRGLDVLEMAARAEGGVSLQEVAGRLGVKPPTAHNLLRTLLARGFLEKSARPVRYWLGSSALGLVEDYFSRSLARRAAGALQALFAHAGRGTATLAEALGGEVLVTLRVSAERPGVVEQPRGRTLHPYGSASTLLFQALWPTEERAAYRQLHPFAESGAHLWDSIDRLDAYLSEARGQGHVALAPLKQDGVYRAAAPVFGRRRELVAAVGVSHAAGQLSEAAWRRRVEEMLDAAARLSAAE